jgi:hypothetical protein
VLRVLFLSYDAGMLKAVEEVVWEEARLIYSFFQCRGGELYAQQAALTERAPHPNRRRVGPCSPVPADPAWDAPDRDPWPPVWRP